MATGQYDESAMFHSHWPDDEITNFVDFDFSFLNAPSGPADSANANAVTHDVENAQDIDMTQSGQQTTREGHHHDDYASDYNHQQAAQNGQAPSNSGFVFDINGDARMQDAFHTAPAAPLAPSDHNKETAPATSGQTYTTMYQASVPPTPTSFEIQDGLGVPRRFDAQQYVAPGHEDMAAFTPLISPDMTPLEHQFRMVPEYTFSGQHLTPLTSPAINAMNMPQAMMQPIHQGFRPNASIAAPQGAPEDHSYNSTEANGSTAMSAQHSAQSSYGHDYASPSIQASTGPTASMSAVAGLPMGVASTQYAPRRTPHQHSMSASSSMRGTAGISRARQSPSILAQKRKKTASEEEQQQTPSSTALAIPEHVESQADPLMPPPALPPPSRRASFPTKPATNASASTAIAAAATPATLMRLSRRRKSTNISASAISPQISPPQPGSAQSLQQVQNDAHFVTPTSTTSTPFMGPPGSDATSVPDETSTILPQMEDIQLPDPAHVDQSITGVATNPSTASHTKPQPVLAPASSQTLNSGTANGNALQSANPTTPNATHYGEGNDRDPYSASASPVTPRSSQHIHAQQQQSQQQTQLQNNVQRDSSTSRPAPKRRESGHTIRHSASGSSTSSGPKRKHSARSLSTIVPKPTGPGPSPAIRPKLSPSIQPSGQLDVASMGYDATTLHLASKSNYQRIIDGTLLPGVSYPETLAENLSSKRTNHKLAEQGRRNRINAALKEIETLIPSTFAQQYSQSKEREKEKNGGNAGSPVISAKSSQPISKASTVEMAIVYIKALQAELGETKQRLDQYEGNFGHNQKEQQQPTQQSAGLDDAVPATEVQSSELSQGVAKASEAG